MALKRPKITTVRSTHRVGSTRFTLVYAGLLDARHRCCVRYHRTRRRCALCFCARLRFARLCGVVAAGVRATVSYRSALATNCICGSPLFFLKSAAAGVLAEPFALVAAPCRRSLLPRRFEDGLRLYLSFLLQFFVAFAA